LHCLGLAFIFKIKKILQLILETYIEKTFGLKNKIACVTGCNKGIGLALAEGLALAGADIIAITRSIQKEDSPLAEKIKSAGKKLYSYQCDFSDRESIYTCVKELNSHHPNIDILVNNAGMIKRNPIIEHSDAYWDEVISVNLTSQFIFTREIGTGMLKQGSGKIIFIASLLSFQGGILVPGYAASKGGINSLIKSFSNEWANKGININGIAPGYISTENTAALRSDTERSTSILSRIPASRWGDPEDLVGSTIFLASKASDYMNGTIITVDGGWMGR